MPTKLRKLEITKVDLCKAGADPDAHIEIYKSRDAELPHSSTPHQEDTSVAKPKQIDITKATPEEAKAYVADLEKSLADTEAELVKAQAPPVPPKKDPKAVPQTEDEVIKSLPEPIQKMITDLQTIAKSAEDRAKAAEDVAKKADVAVAKAQAAAELVEIKKTVEKDMPKVPGTVDAVAKMLQEAKATLTADSYAVLEKALKAGSAAIAKAETEIGGGSGSVAGSALEEINKRADELVKAGTCKTRPEAIEIVAKSDADLYNRYKAEKRAAARAA